MKALVLTASAARGLDALPADARSQVSDGLDSIWDDGQGRREAAFGPGRLSRRITDAVAEKLASVLKVPLDWLC